MKPRIRLAKSLAYPLSVPLVSRIAPAGRMNYLIRPGITSPLLAFSRSQVAGVESIGLGSDDATQVRYAADLPRFIGSKKYLRFEGQRTNVLAHGRTVGDAPWSLNGMASIAPAIGPDGVSDTGRFLTEDTNNANHGVQIANVNVTAGINYTFTFMVKPGTCTNFQMIALTGGFGAEAYQNFVLTGDGTLGTGGTENLATEIKRFGSWYRISLSAQCKVTTTTGVLLALGNSPSNSRNPFFFGTGRTLTVSWANMQSAAAFGSSLILPPAGAPAAATRGGENLTASLSALGIGANGASTFIVRGLVDGSSLGSTWQFFLVLSDGTNTNYIALSKFSGTASISARRVTGGSGSDGPAAGTIIGNTEFVAGISIDGTGRAAVCFNGGSVVGLLSGPTSGLNTLRFGNNAVGSVPLFGEISLVGYLPYALSDSALQAAVSSFPIS